MLLKRNSDVKLWGWNKAGFKVSLIAEWNPTDTLKATCDCNGRFEAKVATPDAGGPYKIEIIGADAESKVIENVMIGEVWICGGQSNMHMCPDIPHGTKVDYDSYFAELDNPNIRTFVTPLVGEKYPQSHCDAQWQECNAQTIGNVSFAAYFFAERLQKELGVPIGIVMSSWGGTNAETWISESFAQSNDDVAKSASAMSARNWKPIATGSLYNGMINPLVPFSFSGAIWYQGESNVVDPSYYASSMRTLVDCWRADFGSQMPFYAVQIAPYDYKGESLNKSPYLREQQTIAAQYDNCGQVVINDLVDDVKNIHPKNKLDVGYRLADMALQRHYQLQGYDSYYPEVQGVEIKGDKVILTIKNCGGGVELINPDMSGFQLATAEGDFVDAAAKVKGNVVTLSAKGVKSPLYVRYLFDDAATCAVKGKNGLPLIPFRNDKRSWE